MTVSDTEEQKELASDFKKTMQQVCSSDFIRSYRTDNASQQKLYGTFKDLGFFDYAGDAGCSITELSLIAKELGFASCPMQPFWIGYARDYVPSHCKFDGEVTPEDIGFIIDGNAHFLHSADATTVLLIEPSALVSSASTVCLASVKDLSLHGSLDITDPSYKAASFEIKPFSGNAPTISASEIALIIASEICGAGERVLQMTVDYAKTRKQYGATIGSFQAVQHQLAQCLLHTESAWSLVQCATKILADSNTSSNTTTTNDVLFAVRSALVYAAKNIPSVIEVCLQLHGGIGFTWEYDLHLYLRRVKKLAALVGISDEALIQMIDLAA